MEVPKYSELAAVDSYYRLLAAVTSRIEKISWRLRLEKGRERLALWKINRAQEDLDTLRSMRCTLLDIKYATPHDSVLLRVRERFREFGSVSENIMYLFGSELETKGDQDEAEKRFLSRLEIANRNARARDHMNRIHLEVIEKIHLGWFIVFDTLTVSEWNYNKVFKKDSREFEKYIRRFRRLLGYDKETNKHSYFCVTEYGKERGRLHYHCLHFLEKWPEKFSDPNYGAGVPYRRIVDGFRAAWQNGFCGPIAVRFSGDDSFGRLGWRWPVVRNDDGSVTALDPSAPAQMAFYMGKYLNKEKGKDFKWKTRISQKFGSEILRITCQKVGAEALMHLTTIRNWQHLENDLQVTVPLPLMRKVAIAEMLLRLNKGKLSSVGLTKQKLLSKVGPQPRIVEQWRTMIQEARSPSSLNTQCSLTKSTSASAIYEAREALVETLLEYGVFTGNVVIKGVTHK